MHWYGTSEWNEFHPELPKGLLHISTQSIILEENDLTMSDSITISPLTETDIPGAISAIQEAFAEDPYNLWVYNDRTKVS